MPVICSEPFVGDHAHFSDFGFPLSDFQKHAIFAIAEGHHVLVCAPTGSGKTLPAEFAIRHFIRQGKRVIYTSPIKALSNQKYHEFSRKFPDITVGLCTGDIKTNPTADLLIMTAEILNNRLFQLSEKNEENADKPETTLSFQMNLETELAAVVMDEVHYINDESRGHVWEQTIMTLPPQVQMIMLSATLDGPEKFAEWIESSRKTTRGGEGENHCNEEHEHVCDGECPYNKRVYLAHTPIRIVPLSHYAFFPKAPETLIKATKSTPLEHAVKTQTGALITLQTANNVFQPTAYKTVDKLTNLWRDKMPGRVSRKHVLNSLATYMKGSDDPDIDDSKLPAIVFLFSRKQVEESALDLTANILPFDSKIPYDAARECEQMIRRLPNWREYAELPEYITLVRLLEKGVGIHHSGMIPILREIVELMISQKKIYLLFATESFAIGLDCPIRTAVFTGLTKYDGVQDRFLYAHEYTQMAGRAGRRGIDTVGHVIHLPLLFRGGGIPTETEYKTILSGTPQKLVSKFHVDYKMVLSLLKKGVTTDFHLFAERSMSKNTIVKEVAEQRNDVENTRARLQEKRAAAEHIRTPADVCHEYIELMRIRETTVNKKRKDADRKIATIKEQHKYIVEDSALLDRIRAMECDLLTKQSDLEATERYLKTQTDTVCQILVEYGIITPSANEYGLAEPLGKIASQLAEVHPIPLSELILSRKWFSGWSARQIVGLLSVFTDVRVPEDQRSNAPKCDDERVLTAIQALDELYSEVRSSELGKYLHTGISYESALCYDMADLMMEWCGLTEEAECKRFFVENCVFVSAGDFAKACMKLSATAKELIAMCDSFPGEAGPTEFAHTLTGVDALILKHIATTQSLYL
jgi:superfamily II RNA helicase